MPLGLIIFLLFNKYLGIASVLESKRHLTYAGHLAALMGNSSLLSPPTLRSMYPADSHISSTSCDNKGWWLNKKKKLFKKEEERKKMLNVSANVIFLELLE